MIQIQQRTTAPGALPSNEGLDSGEQTSVANGAQSDPSVAAAADLLAKFKALFGDAPQVQSFGYADKNGGSGNSTHNTHRSHGASNTRPADAPKAPPPPPVFDVEHVTADQIKGLRKHGQDRLANTIENAKTSYADFTHDGGRVLVTTSKGNGGEPVMIVTGKDFHPTADNKATIHTHYHGDNATVADPMGSKAGTNWRIREAIKNHPQMVFVLPESVVQWGKQQMDTPMHDTSYGASWTNVTSQAQTTQDALNAIGLTDAGKIGTQVVSVHSKGGSVVSQLMGLDASGSRLKADRLELYDSLYGSQGDVAAWGTSKGGAKAQVVYYHGENDARRAKVIENALGSRYTLVDVSKEPKFDDTKNPVYKDAQKNTHTRTKDWDDDNGKKHYAHPTVREHFDDWGSHYRTVGQHLGE